MEEIKPVELNVEQSEIELAYRILQNHGETLYYKDLIDRVLALKPQKGDPVRVLAAIYTQINLDPRFTSFGQGQWGLKAWLPGKNVRRVPTLLPRSADLDESRLEGAGRAHTKAMSGTGEEFDNDEDEWENE